MPSPIDVSAEEQLRLLRAEFSALRHSAAGLSARAESLAQEVEHLKAQQRRDQRLLAELRGSTIWKTTAPVRRARLRLRALISMARR